MSKATKQLDNIFKRLSKITKESIASNQMRSIGEFIADIIRKRTRLGYGVDKDYGSKTKLKGFTQGYREFRQRAAERGMLSSATAPGKSNLTLTGQLLDNYGLIKISSGIVSIGPKGTRKDGLRNADLALYQEEQGRTFNRLSELEFRQVVRFYRRNFGDLLAKKGLIS